MGRIKFALFKWLLKWFCEKELDQWERWKVETEYGDVFVNISRGSPPEYRLYGNYHYLYVSLDKG